MECHIENKGELRLLVCFRDFNKETSKKGIPALWEAHHKKEIGGEVSCCFGICVVNGKEAFKYGIGVRAEDVETVPEGFEKLCLPEGTWAVFKFEASTPEEIQNAWDCIEREFLSSSGEYEEAADYDLEYYPSEGSCEIWIPVKKKEE